MFVCSSLSSPQHIASRLNEDCVLMGAHYDHEVIWQKKHQYRFIKISEVPQSCYCLLTGKCRFTEEWLKAKSFLQNTSNPPILSRLRLYPPVFLPFLSAPVLFTFIPCACACECVWVCECGSPGEEWVQHLVAITSSTALQEPRTSLHSSPHCSLTPVMHTLGRSQVVF